jgi:hypothetical protein
MPALSAGFQLPASDDLENHYSSSEDLLGSNRESSSMSDSVDESDSEEAIFDKIDQAFDFNANNNRNP